MVNIENPLTSAYPIDILLVEDDDYDVLLMRKSLERHRILNNVHRVENGVDAMAFLQREGAYSQIPRPDLVLLDLNMPLKDGREVLKEIKEDAKLQSIPVIVLTTSDDERDVVQSYENMANSYVVKPVDLLQFREAIQTLMDYWFSVVKLSPAAES